jgi:mannose-1-phosphate guanylyltransferase/mannose-6-phosphate isomerase
LQALKRDRQAVVLVLASDHHIPDRVAFCEAVANALPDALDGHLVTFGIKPDRPATGYGYIASGERLQAAHGLLKFHEKPDCRTAEQFVREGYLWNSGNFLFRASAFLEELQKFEPGILDATRDALARSCRDLGCITLNRESLENARSISVDYAVMEHTSRAAVLPVDYQWSDIGNWDAASVVLPGDERQNATHGDVTLHESCGNVVHSSDRLTAVLGIENTIIVTTRDVVLVADRASAENVRHLVDRLREKGRPEAELALQIFRPWGNYEQLDAGEGYQVKRLTVNPGGELSLQKHRHRAEHWVVVRGKAEVTIGGAVSTVGPNQSVHVPLGEVHRLANRGTEPVILIEVQSGDYLGEDDIIRLQDSYNRCENPQTVHD